MVQLLDINQAGAYNSLSAAQGRSSDFISQVGPMAPSWHIENPSGFVPYSAPSAPPAGGFAGFVGHVASSVGHLAGAATDWLARNAAQMATSPVRLGANLGHLGLAAWSLGQDSKQSDVMAGRLDHLMAQYKSGQISAKQYKLGLDDWNQDSHNLMADLRANQQRLSLAGQASVGAGIDVGSALATILTGGIGGFAAKEVGLTTAAHFLAGPSADAGLLRASANLSHLALDAKAFAKLSPGTQFAINHVVAETVANAPLHLTAAQLSRATVANLAFKYPVYYNVLSGAGHDVYAKLDDHQYGAAVQSAAYNALLLLSGGVFGQALKYGGSALKAAAEAVFGQTTFLDELSRGIGNGDPAGLYKAVMAIADPKARAEAVDMLKAAEATNRAAVGAAEPVAAAWRVLNGMKDSYGIDLRNSSHAEELTNLVNHFKTQQLASQAASRLGLEGVTVGRFDPAMREQIVQDLLRADDVDGRLGLWQQMKAAQPNQAWANNANLDKQIKQIITANPSAEDLTRAIRGIEARFSVAGFSSAETAELAKLGYIPIQPKTLEAPLKAGEGKLASAFASNDGLFVKASTPLPVLRPVGQLLTGLGLSPNAATARTYQLFNMNLADNLKDLSITQKLAEAAGTSKAATKETYGYSADEFKALTKQGFSPEKNPELFQPTAAAAETVQGKPTTIEQAADDIVKKLSDYAKAPPGGKLLVRPAFTDLRQLGTRDIARALDISRAEAGQVQTAISRAMLKVPLDVRGLGDRLVDTTYPLLRHYLRYQSAGRFAYNPFFQYLRLIPKTELLTEAGGGGALRAIFTGRWSQIGDIRQALRQAGAFEAPGRLGTVTSGEAVDFAGATGRNLTKALLPMQERSIAGLIDAQASKLGMDYREYIKSFPEQVNDIVQTIAQYDKHANFLNSPLARTLNIAVFPFRFETKVATLMVRGLARTQPLTQVAVLKGLIGAHDWLTSPEGQAWYSANADAIGLFKYVTPIASLNEVFQSLLPGHDHHLGNFGELGGLPFGFIPLLTDSLGLTDFKQPGVNPKTGAIYADYIPVSDRGRVATAISDLLGTLFGYPGATVGLPSKTKLVSGAGKALTGAGPTDFNVQTPQLSAQQQQFSDLVQNLNGQAPPASDLTPPVPGVAVPPQPSQALDPLVRASNKSRKPKKASFSPALLPGQSSYGQLP
jgi:hypothetical protein